MIQPKDTQKFLQALFSGHITESEKILEKLARKYKEPEDAQYLHALQGIFYSYVNDDYDSLIFRIFTRRDMRESRREIQKYLEKMASRPIVGNDPYFKAWADVLALLDKLPHPHKIKPPEEKEKVIEEQEEEENA